MFLMVYNIGSHKPTLKILSVPNGLSYNVNLRWFIKTCMICSFSYFYLRQKRKGCMQMAIFFTSRISIVLTFCTSNFYLMEVIDCMQFQQYTYVCIRARPEHL